MPPITAIFRAADKTDMGWSYMPMDKPVLSVQLTAATFPGLEDEVRKHVAALGHHCAVHLQLPRGQRKPNGWDRFTRGLDFIEYKGDAPAVTKTGRPKPHGMTMTKAEALAIQAKQLDHYAPDPNHPLRAAVAAKTKADALDDEPYSVIEINEHIPRGCDIEWALADLRARGVCA